MRIVCANHSNLPSPPGPDPLAAVLHAQAAAGLDLITDGQLDWTDPVVPLLGRLDGVRLGPVRPLPGGLGPAPSPVVEGKLRRHGSLCTAAYRQAAALARRPLKVALTGPYTLAHAARIATTAYRDSAHLAEELSMVLAQEVAALAAAGAAAIQIDEPLILYRPADVRLLRALLEPVYDAAAGTAQMIVSVYGGDASPLYAQLNSLPADVIGLDCATHPGLRDVIAQSGAGKPLALGIVDAATAPTVPVAELARLVEDCLRRYVHGAVMLQPASGLRGAAPETAAALLALLPQTRASLGA